MNRRSQNIAVALVLFSVALISLVLVTQVGKSDDSTNLASATGEQVVEAAQSTTSTLNDLALDPAAPSITTQTTLLATTSTTQLISSTSTSLVTATSATTTTEQTETESTTESTVVDSSTTAVEPTQTTQATTEVTITIQLTVPTTQVSTTQTATTQATSTSAADTNGMNAVEIEIARLTNELRANPNGPLKRQKPPPADGVCSQLLVDRQTGQYEPLSRLQVSTEVSLRVARPWSVQLTRNLVHQSNAGGDAMNAAGISWRAIGENVAFHNYSEKAINHFSGWRESDGHFCNMMNPRYTHIGVGEDLKANGDSMATQTFYTP